MNQKIDRQKAKQFISNLQNLRVKHDVLISGEVWNEVNQNAYHVHTHDAGSHHDNDDQCWTYPGCSSHKARAEIAATAAPGDDAANSTAPSPTFN